MSFLITKLSSKKNYVAVSQQTIIIQWKTVESQFIKSFLSIYFFEEKSTKLLDLFPQSEHSNALPAFISNTKSNIKIRVHMKPFYLMFSLVQIELCISNFNGFTVKGGRKPLMICAVHGFSNKYVSHFNYEHLK